jgi:hypothetical protein
VENQLVSGEVKSGAEAIFRLDHDCGENFSTGSKGCTRFGSAPKAPGFGDRRGIGRNKAHRPSH